METGLINATSWLFLLEWLENESSWYEKLFKCARCVEFSMERRGGGDQVWSNIVDYTNNVLIRWLLFVAGIMRRNAETGKVRATDPRPCPKCNKIYRSAHTLRTHLEDKHTICPGYRCVLCGTVAKSRNSLHSHMSRQHRGISTKDLPVLPMPSPYDPDLASRLYLKAGIKVSFKYPIWPCENCN